MYYKYMQLSKYTAYYLKLHNKIIYEALQLYAQRDVER
jgi:hypothetical protein